MTQITDMTGPDRGQRVSGGVLLAVGALTFTGCLPALSGGASLFLDAVIWPINGAEAVDTVTHRLLAAIIGGITMGLGAIIWLLAAAEFAPVRDRIRRVVLLGLAVWFVTDSSFSIIAGAPVNAISNTGLLAALVWPIWPRQTPAPA